MKQSKSAIRQTGVGRKIYEALGGEVSRICSRAAIVAVLVGTALNLINQGDAIFSGKPVVIWKIVLTYVVPFIVSTHGALSARGLSTRRQ